MSEIIQKKRKKVPTKTLEIAKLERANGVSPIFRGILSKRD